MGIKVFDNKNFYISKIKREFNSPTKSFIVLVNGYEYEISYNCLDRFLSKHELSIRSLNLRNLHTEEVDNRPYYRKAMDFQMGKKVDFKRPYNYRTIDDRFLEMNLFN